MRRPLFLLAAACAAFGVATPAVAATRNFTVTGFEQIRVEGPFRVKLMTGVPPSASATGTQSALDRVAIDVLGRTLVVHSDVSAWSGDSDADTGPVEIRIGTHDLTSAALTGSGSLDIDTVTALSFTASAFGSGAIGIGKADVDQLSVSLSGTSNAVVVGRAGTLTVSTLGTSAFDGTGLAVKDATIKAQGPATIKANVTNSATIQASGPATVILTGNPGCTTHASGSSSVSGCRASQ